MSICDIEPACRACCLTSTALAPSLLSHSVLNPLLLHRCGCQCMITLLSWIKVHLALLDRAWNSTLAA